MGHRYELSGVHIESDLPLTALPGTAQTTAPELTIRLAEGRSPSPLGDPLLSRSSDGVPWLSVARCKGGYLFRVHDIADFTLDARNAEITCAPFAGCEASVLSQLFIDQIFPLILHVTGRFSLHASAVAVPGSFVIAFLGVGGQGKSTLAASLARTSAFTFVSDDCLALTPVTTGVSVTTGSPVGASAGVLAHPSYPSSRLWPPSAEALFREQGDLPFASPRTDKKRVALPLERAPLPLRRVYLLEDGEGSPALQALRPRDALAALAAHLYRLDFQDRARLAEEIAVLEQVVTTATVKRLSYRRSFAELPAVHAVIHADI